MNIASFTQLRPVVSVVNLFFRVGCFSILCVPSQLKSYFSFPKLGSSVYSDKQMYVCMVFVIMCGFLIFVFKYAVISGGCKSEVSRCVCWTLLSSAPGL